MKAYVVKDWNIEELSGYHPLTTFYTDFSIADHYGVASIIDTYNRVMEAWKSDYKWLTELVMVLNWKIWEHYKTNREYAKVYDELWKKADEYALDNLKDDELSYFFEITD